MVLVTACGIFIVMQDLSLQCTKSLVVVHGKNETTKLNIQETKIVASSPITSWQIDGEIVETVLT